MEIWNQARKNTTVVL